MKILFTFIIYCLLTLNLKAQQSSYQIDPSVAFVTTGNYWENSEISGIYRVLVINQGFEHVSSDVYIQWLQENVEKSSFVVLNSLLVKEVSNGQWSIGQPELQTCKKNSICIINGTNPYTLEEKSWIIKLGDVGKYLLENQ